MLKQKTIKQECAISGVGLHTGASSTVKFKPAPANSGITFIRVDLPGAPIIKVNADNVSAEAGMLRCTSVGKGDHVIRTVEHLMSALCGLEITNLTIEINAQELPGLDGSGIDYYNAFKNAGILEQDVEAQIYQIKEPIGVELNGCSIFVVPASDFRISYTLSYNHPLLKSQFVDFRICSETYEKEIGPARTFCLEKEAQELQSKGLGLGANFQNTLVVGDNGVINNKIRYPDEFARHKVLDFIGDLYLLGLPIRGHVYAIRSGHTLNIQLLKKIEQQKRRYERTRFVPEYDFSSAKEIDINGISKILPHRYPFLLVDRVIEIEKGKKAVGIKNVTINDNFFQGHFPQKPVMPGVMMVEAMAQTAGVVVLTSENHRGQLAFFLSADKVKFRKLVTPGDQLFMEVEVIRDRSSTAQARAVAKVAGEVVAEADMVFSFIEGNFLNE